MHTAMIIGTGLVVLAVFVLAARLLGGSVACAARWFIPVWLVAALANMWVGVTQAGYTVSQEAPITIVVFAVPALVAWLIARSYRAQSASN